MFVTEQGVADDLYTTNDSTSTSISISISTSTYDNNINK